MITSNNIPVVTLDGPCGSGKGEIGQRLAEKLNWHYLDSGAIYRVLAFSAIKNRISSVDTKRLVSEARSLDLEFISQPGSTAKIIFEGKDITVDIRKPDCTNLSSKISSIPEVREALTQYQRSFAKHPGLIADGRDMGTVIFPNAGLKIFLTATAKERARRRFLQLQSQGVAANLDDVLKDLMARDKRDIERAISPLKPSDDAIVIDTTEMSIKDILEKILASCGLRFGISVNKQ